MKSTASLLLVILLHWAVPTLSQSVSITGRHLRLQQVFKAIQKQTGYEFIYPSHLLDATRPIDLHVRNAPLPDVLSICVQGQGLGFSIHPGTIVIFVQAAISPLPQPTADTAAVVRGRIVDFRGQPIEMASVVLKRTKKGTQSDLQGIFSLLVSNLKTTDTLDISFVGLKTRLIPIGGQIDLGTIMLQAADNALDQSVITAYGSTSERFRTGDITTVKAAAISRSPAENVTEALAGRVPGLYVRQNGGNPSSVYTLQLRGVNVLPPSIATIGGEAEEVLSKPLIVVDGLPLAPDLLSANGQNYGIDAITGLTGSNGGQDALYWLNPLDVESLTVLKDADATALYGSRAANGVILINTKKGKPGKMSLNLSANTGINVQARKLDLLSTPQYLAMRHEAWNNSIAAHLPVITSGIDYVPTAANSYDLLTWDTTKYTDWQKTLLGSAPVYNANAELTGGEGNTGYRLDGAYNGWKNPYPGISGYPVFQERKGSLSLSVSTHSANNRLRLTSSVISYTSDSYQPIAKPDNYIFLPPDAPTLFDAKGHLDFVDWRPVSLFPAYYTGNPLNGLAMPDKANRWGVQLRSTLSYDIIRQLSLTIGMGYSRTEGKQLFLMPGSAIDPIVTTVTRSAISANSNGSGLNVEPTLRYQLRMGRHHLSLMAGGSFQSDRQEGDILEGVGFGSDDELSSLSGATTYYSTTSVIERRAVSGLGQINYRYADKYLLDLSGRRDGSNSFGPGHRFGNFGSVGLGWIFTEEPWARHIPLLSFGKIRGSYGITGTQGLNPYVYLSTYKLGTLSSIVNSSPLGIPVNGNGVYAGTSALDLTEVANPELGWAQATSIDWGVDLYLLPSQQLKLTAQWYRKRTGHQLAPKQVSNITGTSTYLANLPAQVQDAGIEGSITYTSKTQPSRLNWSISLNLAANHNKLLSYPGLASSDFASYYEVGQPLIRQQVYSTYLNKQYGVYTLSDANHPAGVPYRVGSLPTLTGGLQGSLSYKGISLSASCTFAHQKGFTNIQGATYPGVLQSGLGNQAASVLKSKRWKSEADSTIGGAFLATSLTAANQDIFWGDASYLAVKTASLSYSLPEQTLHKIGITAMSFYIEAQNLLMVSLAQYQGTNPERPELSGQLSLRRTLVVGFTINL